MSQTATLAVRVVVAAAALAPLIRDHHCQSTRALFSPNGVRRCFQTAAARSRARTARQFSARIPTRQHRPPPPLPLAAVPRTPTPTQMQTQTQTRRCPRCAPRPCPLPFASTTLPFGVCSSRARATFRVRATRSVVSFARERWSRADCESGMRGGRQRDASPMNWRLVCIEPLVFTKRASCRVLATCFGPCMENKSEKLPFVLSIPTMPFL
jgi:hypothetical protein